MADKNKETFDIHISTTVDTSGAEKVSEVIDEIKEKASESSDKIADSGKAATDALKDEAAAASQVATAAASGISNVAGLAGIIGGFVGAAALSIVASGLEQLITLAINYGEAAEEAAKQQKKIGDEAEESRRKIDAAVKEAGKLKEPAEEWEKALRNSNTALDISLATITSIHGQMEKLLKAQEDLDLAKIEGRTDLTPEDKESAKFSTKAFYANLREQNADRLFDAQADAERQKISAQERAAADAVRDTTAKDIALKEAAAAEKQFVSRKEAAEKRLGTPEEEEIAKAGPFAGPKGYTAARDRIRQERAGLQGWLDSTAKDEERALTERRKDAAEEAKQAKERAQSAAAKATETAQSGGAKIALIDRAKETAREANELARQTRDQEEVTRVGTAAQKKADAAKKAVDKHKKDVADAVDKAEKEEADRKLKALEAERKDAESIIKSPRSTAAERSAARQRKAAADKAIVDLNNPDDPEAAGRAKGAIDRSADSDALNDQETPEERRAKRAALRLADRRDRTKGAQEADADDLKRRQASGIGGTNREAEFRSAFPARSPAGQSGQDFSAVTEAASAMKEAAAEMRALVAAWGGR